MDGPVSENVFEVAIDSYCGGAGRGCDEREKLEDLIVRLRLRPFEAPHWRRGAALPSAALIDRQMAAAVLGKLGRGVIILAPSGQALFVNRAAERLFAVPAGLLVNAQGCLQLLSRRLQQRFVAYLFAARAVTAAEDDALPAPLSLSVRTAAGEAVYQIVVTPLPQRPVEPFVRTGALHAVFIYAKGIRERAPGDLPQFEGFKGAEAEVVRHLLDGHTIDETADELCLSVGTVRAHMRRVFEQLSAESRARLLERLGPGVPRSGLAD
jgi:DNA-binding CsgD family transcriptional regulator